MTHIETDIPLLQMRIWCYDITWQYWYIWIALAVIAVWLINRHFAKHRREWIKEKEEQEVRKVCQCNNINGSSAKTFNDLVAELKCDNLQLTAELRSAQRRIEMLEEKLKRNR